MLNKLLISAGGAILAYYAINWLNDNKYRFEQRKENLEKVAVFNAFNDDGRGVGIGAQEGFGDLTGILY